jgi:hypothetical protein
MTTLTIIERAERAMAAQARETYRREVRDKARHYRRERHLNGVLGWSVPTPNTTPIEATHRIIRALGHRLHSQVMSGHPLARRRIRHTRTALFGEIYGLWRLQEAAE